MSDIKIKVDAERLSRAARIIHTLAPGKALLVAGEDGLVLESDPANSSVRVRAELGSATVSGAGQVMVATARLADLPGAFTVTGSKIMIGSTSIRVSKFTGRVPSAPDTTVAAVFSSKLVTWMLATDGSGTDSVYADVVVTGGAGAAAWTPTLVRAVDSPSGVLPQAAFPADMVREVAFGGRSVTFFTGGGFAADEVMVFPAPLDWTPQSRDVAGPVWSGALPATAGSGEVGVDPSADSLFVDDARLRVDAAEVEAFRAVADGAVRASIDERAFELTAPAGSGWVVSMQYAPIRELVRPAGRRR